MPYVKLKYLDDIPRIRTSLKNYSVVIETDKVILDEDIQKYADKLLKLKCKDFNFTGNDKDRWHATFDHEDDRVSDGKALTANIDDISFLSICKHKVMVFHVSPEIRIKKRKEKII